MDDSHIISSRNELLFVIIFALICTISMTSFDAFERLYLFTHTYYRRQFGEFAVFFPAFLAIGITYFSYRRIRELEVQITKRIEAEQALRDSEQKYKDLSITDELTQLYNSRHFYDRLNAEIDRTRRYEHPLSMLMLDIDNFKHFNDKYGHLEGDKVLSGIGDVISKCIRRTDTAFRYGGEEFIVILPETKREGALIVAERIRERFEAKAFSPAPDETVHETLSVGITQYRPEEDMESFVHRTDSAMYDAKEQGKNRVVFSTHPNEE
jgi:two-component system cell cycle response regulator